MIVTVTQRDLSKNGKVRIYFSNRHNWPDAYYLGSKCPEPDLGQRIDAETSSKDFNNNGKPTYFLNAWKPASALAEQNSAPQSATLPSAQVSAPTKPLVGWPDVPTGDLSRLVSNVVASAIAACLIQKPSDMAQWVGAAYRACEGLRTGKIVDFDDPVPAFGPMPEDEGDPADGHGYEDMDDDRPEPF